MRRNRRFLGLASVAAALLALAGGTASAKLDPAQWHDAEAKWKELYAESGSIEEKLEVLKAVATDGEPRAFDLIADGLVREVGILGKLTELHGKAMAKLQIYLSKRNNDWRPGEEREMEDAQIQVHTYEKAMADERRVYDALIRAVAMIGEAGRKAVLSRAKGHGDWAVRAAGAKIAAESFEEAASKAMLVESFDKERDPRVRLAGVQGFANASGKAWHPMLLPRLEDSDWTVQVEAARIAGQREVASAIPILIQALVKAPPRAAEEITEALRKLTRQSFEPYADVWAKWWGEHKGEFGADGRPVAPAMSGPRPEDVTFYGLKIKSDRVVFVIDTSGSMKEEMKSPPPRPVTTEEKPAAPERAGTKIEVAKQQLRLAITALPKTCMFNVIAFNNAVRQWQPKMMPATPENKESALAWFRDEPPKSSTYIDGALRAAFALAGNLGFDKQYSQQKIDTIVLLSDGAPTDNSMPTGKDMDPEEILAHVREWNANKLIVINCVGIDNVVKGIKFMKDLAKQNGGTYVDG